MKKFNTKLKQSVFLILSLFLVTNCKNNSAPNEEKNKTEKTNEGEKIRISEAKVLNIPEDYVPKGFVIFEKIKGDLNLDGQEDLVFIIKDTQKSNIIRDEYKGKQDRNRRGILVIIKNNDDYELLVKNTTCFSSELEDGGVYFPPDLWLEIKKGKLLVNYSHGRYGYWSYMFRLQNSDLELIGYENSSNYGPIVSSKTSINFLTKVKIESRNVNQDEGIIEGEEIFEETKSKIKLKNFIKLSEIVDFDELDMSEI